MVVLCLCIKRAKARRLWRNEEKMQIIYVEDGKLCWQDILKQMATRVLMTPLQIKTQELYSNIAKEKGRDFKESF